LAGSLVIIKGRPSLILKKIALKVRKPRPKEKLKTPYLKKFEIDFNKIWQEAWLS